MGEQTNRQTNMVKLIGTLQLLFADVTIIMLCSNEYMHC
jgi:hypothetical protein